MRISSDHVGEQVKAARHSAQAGLFHIYSGRPKAGLLLALLELTSDD